MPLAVEAPAPCSERSATVHGTLPRSAFYAKGAPRVGMRSRAVHSCLGVLRYRAVHFAATQ